MVRTLFPWSLLHAAALTAALLWPQCGRTESSAPVPTIQEKTHGLRRMEGLFPLAYDAGSGRLYLQIARLDQDFLFLDSLPYGLGFNDVTSNDLGLDRGQLGKARVVHFTRFGPRVLLVQANLDYRASSPDADERLTVRQSFAESVLWGFKIEAEDNGSVLVDATDFFLQDAHGVAERLADQHQGKYKLDPGRSALTLENTKNFPLNTEVESLLTFATDEPVPDSLVATVTPDAHAVTLREHYSFVQLPEPGYKPRAFDPRAGFFPVQYRDYSAPLGSPLDIRLIARHRLEKKDPNAAVSEPVKPLIYYVDRGTPEPIRSALIEGANWWQQAFQAAGFKNAFRVEVLPPGADPMDVRYNMIQWVHRSTRGWSYGESVVDPRTGEIIKGQVTLGSLRARQDYLIGEALLSPYAAGKTASPEIQQMVLARLRQLAAHEVGHTLGLEHNFAASALRPGDSVMDYPHPRITLDGNGRPDLSHAYTSGIGDWDRVAIAYGYSQFAPDVDEHAALDAILRQASDAGQVFITDADSRPPGSLHPQAHLWDNGPDPAAELERILAIRSAALERFGENAIQNGTPVAQLEDTLVPLYLLHRYQTQAAAKEIGGLSYEYALRGENQPAPAIVSAADQRRALTAVLKTLSPETLAMPEPLLKLLPPRPPGYPRTQESFAGHTGLAFDPLGAAESAAELTASLLFEPTRAARLVEYHARDAQMPGLDAVIEAAVSATWKAPRRNGMEGEVQRTTEAVVLNSLLTLAADSGAGPQARALARSQAIALRSWLTSAPAAAPEEKALRNAAAAEIEAFERSPEKWHPAKPAAAPPGQPIGDDQGFD